MHIDGYTKCDLNPHEYQSQIQKSIITWLSQSHIDPHNNLGCPGFSDWRNK